MLEQRSVRSPPTEEEAAAQTVSDELTTAPILCPSDCWERRVKGMLGVKIKPGKKEERCFNILFYFSLC